jgi:hypothetical protein
MVREPTKHTGVDDTGERGIHETHGREGDPRNTRERGGSAKHTGERGIHETHEKGEKNRTDNGCDSEER